MKLNKAKCDRCDLEFNPLMYGLSNLSEIYVWDKEQVDTASGKTEDITRVVDVCNKCAVYLVQQFVAKLSREQQKLWAANAFHK